MGNTRNPFRGLMDHMSEMARMREYAEGGGNAGPGDLPRTHATAWVPTTDIFVRDRDLVIRCELAGVDREHVDVSLSGGVLTIDGERTGEPDDSTFYTRERYYGRFRRRIRLPEGVESADLNADFENGLLEITVKGGADHPEPERIEIGA